MQTLAEIWQFGRFRLEPGRRLLLAEGVPIPISARAFDILELLVRNHDRVVTREEIVAHVWRGVTVGENNLAVQMSGLRRTLGEHADGQSLIVNLPGRGYRLVAEVREPDSEAALHREDQGPEPVRRGTKSASLFWWLLCSAAICLAIAGYAGVRHFQTAGWDPRLSISVHKFESVGNSQGTSDLASQYRESVITRLATYEELRLFPELGSGAGGIRQHFNLDGTVQSEGDRSILAIALTEQPSGRLLYHVSVPISASLSRAEQSSITLQVAAGIRPALFHSEASRAGRRANDPLDLIIQAHDLIGASRQRDTYLQAIGLAARAAASPKADRAIRAYYAYLLNVHMTLTGAQSGNAEGLHALAILDLILQEQPLNTLYLVRRTDVLEALGRLQEAAATARFALSLDQDDVLIRQKYAELLMLQGNIELAKNFLTKDLSNPQDDVEAEIAFIEGRYTDCLNVVRAVIAGSPPATDTPFNILLEVSTLSLVNKIGEAHALLLGSAQTIPADLHTVSSQRQAIYVLPDKSWIKFKEGLSLAGMPP